jgi:hypothetical protein
MLLVLTRPPILRLRLPSLLPIGAIFLRAVAQKNVQAPRKMCNPACFCVAL